MAHTARKGDDKVEYFDSPEVTDEKVSKLAEWIKRASHFVSFTVRAGLTVSRRSTTQQISVFVGSRH